MSFYAGKCSVFTSYLSLLPMYRCRYPPTPKPSFSFFFSFPCVSPNIVLNNKTLQPQSLKTEKKSLSPFVSSLNAKGLQAWASNIGQNQSKETCIVLYFSSMAQNVQCKSICKVVLNRYSCISNFVLNLVINSINRWLSTAKYYS